MPKALSITQNAFAVLALFAIITVSTITTLGLSPVAVDPNAKVAGISTGQDPKILSNFVPLVVSDANDPAPQYTSQLVQLTQSQYQYTATMQAHDTGILPYKLITVTNPNTAAVTVNMTATLAKEVDTSLNIGVTAGDTYRIHDATTKDTRIVQFTIPAGATTTIGVQYELIQPILFPFQVSFTINY